MLWQEKLADDRTVKSDVKTLADAKKRTQFVCGAPAVPKFLSCDQEVHILAGWVQASGRLSEDSRAGKRQGHQAGDCLR